MSPSHDEMEKLSSLTSLSFIISYKILTLPVEKKKCFVRVTLDWVGFAAISNGKGYKIVALGGSHGILLFSVLL